MKLPILALSTLVTTGCGSNSLISNTQPAFTHKAPYLSLSCEELRAVTTDTSIAALHGPFQILASRNTNATGQADISKTRQKAQNSINPDTKVLGHQQAAVWALKVNGCEQNDGLSL